MKDFGISSYSSQTRDDTSLDFPSSLHDSPYELEDANQNRNALISEPIHKNRAVKNNEIESTYHQTKSLDLKSTKKINKRFLSINSKRLVRMRDALARRHRQILDALPILLHCNHPMMPGFVSLQTPHNISNFSPSKKDIQAGRTIARSFTYTLEPDAISAIRSIFVMGSTGTIAQSGHSDLDIWLCCEDNLTKNQRDELERKAKKISTWAEEANLEIHFFLMSTEVFSKGKLSSLDEESSGSAQRLLLLDEFYRSAIYLCGQTPLWWLIPNTEKDHYQSYSAHLLEQRFIRNQSVIDFGGIASIPAQEFIGAGVWQLYKAIESPYKSVLKLLLLEAYVHEYPNIEPLSQTFKQLVYGGEEDINQLDGYLLVYRRIEKYLQSQGNSNRLELARRCFYLKVNKPLSKPFRGKQKSWQRSLLEKLVKQWSWTHQYIFHIDTQYSWKTQKILEERSILISELTRSYRILLNFSNNSKTKRSISTEELTILGRKLNAAFERRPGKIENFNGTLNHDLSEERVYLFEHQLSNQKNEEDLNKNLRNYSSKNQPHNTWSCFNQPINDTSVINSSININPNANTFNHKKNHTLPNPTLSSALKMRSNLVELLTWLYLNGIASRANQFDLQHSQSCTLKSIEAIFISLKKWLQLPLKAVAHQNFHRPTQPTKVLFLLNASDKPTLSSIQAQGFQRLSNKIDALSYGQFDENLVYSVDMLILNSWNEISIRHFSGEDCLRDALQEYLQLSLPGTHQNTPERMVLCIDEEYRVTITRRCRQWLDDICECFYHKHPPSTRYIFQFERKLLCLQFKNMQPVLKQFSSDDMLIDFLGQEQHRYSPIVLDSQAFKNHPLRCISEHARPKTISVYYRNFDMGIEIFTIDERGSLSHSVYRGRKDHNPLRPLHRFIKTCLQRQAIASNTDEHDFTHMNIAFFQLVTRNQNGQQNLIAEPRSISCDSQTLPGFEVKAIVWDIYPELQPDNLETLHKQKPWTMDYEFSCENKQFCTHEFGPHTFHAVAEYILELRQNYRRYPIYISDLDLSLSGQNSPSLQKLQTNHYLRIKNALEFQLNRALRAL